MEYQKLRHLLDSGSNKLFKFRTKNWIEINHDSHGAYKINGQIRFKFSMQKSSWWDYSDVDMLVNDTITNTGGSVDNTKADRQIILTNTSRLADNTKYEQTKEKKEWYLKTVQHSMNA